MPLAESRRRWPVQCGRKRSIGLECSRAWQLGREHARRAGLANVRGIGIRAWQDRAEASVVLKLAGRVLVLPVSWPCGGSYRAAIHRF